ncbi:MAG: MBOAT family protein [Firmicutes bacterium]|nr:MBOAT family protein [Bacillota bacterium]
MALTSPEFLLLTAASVLLYYLLPGRFQWPLLLAAGLLFYCAGGGLTVLYVIAVALTVWASALLIEARRERRRLISTLCCVLNFGLLFVLKYLGFTLEMLGVRSGLSFVLPLGISFFMFQAVGYLIDVYREKYAPERNFAKFLLFVSFFPQMTQGPISRYGQLAPQLFAERRLDFEDLRLGIQLMMWGYFKKLVIADRAAVLVKTVMNDPWSYGGFVQAWGVLFYCIQLYCDFSGGIDIVRGVARLYGIDMAENFRRPLLATSLTDFWRRWHISLGAWMRDYVFYPLTLSKAFIKLGKKSRKAFKGRLGKMVPTSLATFIIYFIIGIWHGASWKYVAFGFWNGIIITASLLLAPSYERWKTRLRINGESLWWRAFCVLRTNVIVFLGRYITRAPRLLTAFWMMSRLIADPRPSELRAKLFGLGITKYDYLVIVLSLIVMLLVEFYEEKKGSFRELLAKQGAFVQWMAIVLPLLIIMIFGIFRADYISSDFIYKNY